jgi:hypothetical protein
MTPQEWGRKCHRPPSAANRRNNPGATEARFDAHVLEEYFGQKFAGKPPHSGYYSAMDVGKITVQRAAY